MLGDSQEERLPLSLVVLDCDDFKDVNDRAGHEFGDALLREVGLVLREICPEGSSPARLGGDEFVVTLPGIEVDEAVEVIERLRRELSEGLDEAGFPLRLSAGISTYPYDGAGTTQLLRAADQALYSAKARGKNRVVSFREVIRASGHGTSRFPRGERSRTAGDPAPVGRRDRRGDGDLVGADRRDVIERLGKMMAFVVGATARRSRAWKGRTSSTWSRIRSANSRSATTTSIGISDYPVTQEVLERPCIRSVSFLDEDLDAGEAFVLRELQMNAAMLLPLRVNDRSWGLVEIYDMRMRRYTPDDEALAGFLVAQAGRRLETLRGRSGDRRGLRRLRPAR